MKSSYLINSVLIALALGLYWLLNQPQPTPQQQKISQISPSDITTITIIRDGLDTISLQKTAANWQLSQPFQAPANNTRVKLLLSILTATSYAQLASADSNTLNQLGLNKTSALLQLNDNGFQFGEIESISKRRYVLHNDLIHLINDNVAPLLNANAASFINNKLIPLNNQISKLSIPAPNTNSITIKQKQGRWISDNKALSSDQLALLVEAWQHAYALQVLPSNTAKLPSSEPQRITVWYHNQAEPVVFELQSDDKSLYLNDSLQQLSYQFPISIMQQLLPDA